MADLKTQMDALGPVARKKLRKEMEEAKKVSRDYVFPELTAEQRDKIDPAKTLTVWDTQVGGGHYKSMAIQPTEFIMKNNIPFADGCAIKYICRHRLKNGKEDLEKAIHYIQMIIDEEYGE